MLDFVVPYQTLFHFKATSRPCQHGLPSRLEASGLNDGEPTDFTPLLHRDIRLSLLALRPKNKGSHLQHTNVAENTNHSPLSRTLRLQGRVGRPGANISKRRSVYPNSFVSSQSSRFPESGSHSWTRCIHPIHSTLPFAGYR